MAVSTDTPFSDREIRSSLKVSKDTAPGIDRISYSMLKHHGEKALAVIRDLFNKSLYSGKLPSPWKQANIQSIPKPVPKLAFRPISLLSCLSKSMERAIPTRLTLNTTPSSTLVCLL